MVFQFARAANMATFILVEFWETWHSFFSSHSDPSATTISSSVGVLHLYPQAASSCKHSTVLRGLMIKWPQVLVLTVIANDLPTPWDLGAKHVLFFCSKPFRVLELQHKWYRLVSIPGNISCLETTRVGILVVTWLLLSEISIPAAKLLTLIMPKHKIILTGQSLWLMKLPFYHLLVEDP